jgi:ABC-type tungstate transport system permease subunit
MKTNPILAAAMALCIAGVASAQDSSIIVQSTTSTANSGLYDYLLPLFKETSGIQVNVVAVGTGRSRMPRTAMAMSCWFMPRRRKRNSSPTGLERFGPT